MREFRTGVETFGLDMEGMVKEAWRVFRTRSLTWLGISILVMLGSFVAHFLYIGVFFWLPFSLCIPFAVVMILAREKTDRIFLGWVDYYPRLLTIFLPAALVFLVTVPIVMPKIGGFEIISDRDVETAFAFPREVALKDSFLSSYLVFAFPLLLEKILAFTFGLAGLLSIRRKLSPTEALIELFATKRHTVEAFLLGGTLAVLSLSGFLVCCIGVIATTTFAWICLGVAYYQIFEK
ncbi:MAG: hypothetical protein KC917_03815 [Candidatus Omnitrophica bacterium]|nr:hypothetical protein [Candidatus Omnitrophota bacterium]